jgi:hypothetical protein
VEAQGEAVAVRDVEHVEDVPRAAHEAEHLRDVHDVARPRAGEQLAELRALKRVKAAGGADLLLQPSSDARLPSEMAYSVSGEAPHRSASNAGLTARAVSSEWRRASGDTDAGASTSKGGTGVKQYRKLIVAGVIAAALTGGVGAAMASAGGGNDGTDKGKQTESYSVPHRKGSGPAEKSLDQSATDDGKPSLNREGTPPSHGGTPDTRSYPAR